MQHSCLYSHDTDISLWVLLQYINRPISTTGVQRESFFPVVTGLAAVLLYRVFCQRIRSAQSGSVHIQFNDWSNGTPNDSTAGQCCTDASPNNTDEVTRPIKELQTLNSVWMIFLWPTWLVEVHSWCPLPPEGDCRRLSSLWPAQGSWTWPMLQRGKDNTLFF